MRFCNSAIFVSFTSTGTGGCKDVVEDLAVAWGFFPPVSHMMTIMSSAMPTITHDWTFLGRRPGERS